MSIFVGHPCLGGLLFAEVLGSPTAIAAGPIAELIPLSIDFYDEAPGQPLGSGGVARGEPVSLGYPNALVVEASPGENLVQISDHLSSTNARSLSWEFEDSAEFSEGLVSISMHFTPSAQDHYSLDVREHGGSTRQFAGLTFTSNGDLSVDDAAGYMGTYYNVYDSGDTLHIELLFDMEARTSSLTINGNTLYVARAHGISHRGIGKLMIGHESISNGSPFVLDNLLVLANVPLPLVPDTDFNNQPPGQPIGIDGDYVGEPVCFSAADQQQAISIARKDAALQLWNPTQGLPQFPLWEFWKGLEIDSGIVIVEMDLRFQASQSYEISVNGPPNAGAVFTSVRFSPNRFPGTRGHIDIVDSRGSTSNVGLFETNVFQRLQIAFDMDAGTYTVKLDGIVVVANRPHGVASGVGIASLQTGFPRRGYPSIPLDIDNLRVGVDDSRFVP